MLRVLVVLFIAAEVAYMGYSSWAGAGPAPVNSQAAVAMPWGFGSELQAQPGPQ